MHAGRDIVALSEHGIVATGTGTGTGTGTDVVSVLWTNTYRIVSGSVVKE
jgi:hypothetical protein